MVDQPPKAPEINRQFSLHPYQLIGIPLLFLVPVLAMLGVFGESFTQTRQASADLVVTVDYPTRYRYKMLNTLTVAVQNISDQPISRLTAAFTNAYMNRFSEVSFSPSVAQITDTAHEVVLQNIAPQETRLVTVEMQAEQYGQHEGLVLISAEGLEPVSIPVHTFVFP